MRLRLCVKRLHTHIQCMFITNTEAEPLIDIIKMMNVTEEASSLSTKSCLDYVANGFSRITVKVVGSSYLRRSQSISMSFSDKLGVIGGTIGLFSGFSFVALFEFVYWIVITLIKYFKSSVEPEEEDLVEKQFEEMKKEILSMKAEMAKLKETPSETLVVTDIK